MYDIPFPWRWIWKGSLANLNDDKWGFRLNSLRSVDPSCVCLLSEFNFIQLDATQTLARTLLLFSWTTQDNRQYNNGDLHSQCIELKTICFCPAYYYINFVSETKKKTFIPRLFLLNHNIFIWTCIEIQFFLRLDWVWFLVCVKQPSNVADDDDDVEKHKQLKLHSMKPKKDLKSPISGRSVLFFGWLLFSFSSCVDLHACTHTHCSIIMELSRSFACGSDMFGKSHIWRAVLIPSANSALCMCNMRWCLAKIIK